MQVVPELSLSFPFVHLSALYTFYILRAPLELFHLDPLECTAQFVVCDYDVRNSSIGMVTKPSAHSLHVLVNGAGMLSLWVTRRPAPYVTTSL